MRRGVVPVCQGVFEQVVRGQQLVVHRFSHLAVGQQRRLEAHEHRFHQRVDPSVARGNTASEVFEVEALGGDRARGVLQGPLGQPHLHDLRQHRAGLGGLLLLLPLAHGLVDRRPQDRFLVVGNSSRWGGRSRTSSSVSRSAWASSGVPFVLKIPRRRSISKR